MLVDKPAGPSSFAVVADLRRRYGTKAGHAGTLDPLATGLLLVLLYLFSFGPAYVYGFVYWMRGRASLPRSILLAHGFEIYSHLWLIAGWTAIVERGTIVLLDTRITDELKREGQAREVIRHVQSLRKDTGLEMDDRIVLHLSTPEQGLKAAIEAHRDYICDGPQSRP